MEDKAKIIEKRYIEINSSGKQRFFFGLLGGIGWGIGLTLGTAAIIVTMSFFASKINFVPILGQFLADVIKESQANLHLR